ncbi:hypothetical protein LBMAG53_26870 [Planctomycetota bacterium]|nr:hypothetical protein LBMAG53_26870 [Planctomycetota bacterium]
MIGDPVLRAGIPWRVVVYASDLPTSPGQLRLILRQGGKELSELLVELPQAAQADGAVLAPVAAVAGPDPVAIDLSVERLERTAGTTDRVLARATATIPTAAGIARDYQHAAAGIVARVGDRSSGDAADLHRALGDHLLTQPPSLAVCTRLAVLAAALSGEVAAAEPFGRPWRDEIDGGVRGVRRAGEWSRADDPVVAVIGSADPLLGGRISSVDPGELPPALLAGKVALVAPGGNPHWAAQRLLAQAVFAQCGNSSCFGEIESTKQMAMPVVIVAGIGSGAEAAIVWAQRHVPSGMRPPVVLINPRFARLDQLGDPADFRGVPLVVVGDGDPAAERWVTSVAAAGAAISRRTPGSLVADDLAPRTWPKALPQSASPQAPSYAGGPFTVVIGTGESLAAAADARALAERFAEAWLAYSGARPRLVEDSAPETAWVGNLVLIGTTRSNRVLAGLAVQCSRSQRPLPVEWDHRERRSQAMGRVVVEHRSLIRPFALAWPFPDRPGRLLVILDGAPAWPTAPGWRLGDLPLAGLGVRQ